MVNLTTHKTKHLFTNIIIKVLSKVNERIPKIRVLINPAMIPE